MANLLLNPVYITRDDVRDTTDNAALIALSDDAIDMLITQAQYLIDAYLICYGVPFDETQEFIFPIDVDGVATIPDKLKIAAFYVVEKLFSLDSISGSSTGAIIEEKILSRTVKYKDVSSSEIDNYIPLAAQELLNDFVFT